MARQVYIGLVLSLTLVTIPVFAQCRFPAGGTGRILSYTFDSTLDATGTVLHGVRNLRALSADTIISDTTLAGNKTIRHPPDQDVVLTYDVVKDWTGRFRHPAEFHGTLMPDYLELTGDTALVHPKLSADARVTVHFDWSTLPSAWVLATSFGVSSSPDERCQSYSGTWIAVQHSLFAAGAFRIHHFRIGMQPGVLAIRDQWTFSDDEAIAQIQKAIGVVRDFWHDQTFPYFLVTLKQFDNDSGNGDGSSFTNAFWMYLSRKDLISDQIPVLIHETFHEWDPRRMGPASSPEDWKAIAWFREGFVSYYGYLLALRAGLMPLPAYLDNLNSDLRIFPASSNPYVRGRVIALWLDHQIRKDSGGKRCLDTVMYDMVNEAAKPLTEARILETTGRYILPASRTELARVLQLNSPISLYENGLGPCVRGSIDQVPTFDLGFDLAASTATGTITGVEADSPAFQAGLRNGQRLSGRLSVYNNQPEKAAIVTVQTSDGQKAVEYYPRGKPIAAMQYHLDQTAYAANPGSCQIK